MALPGLSLSSLRRTAAAMGSALRVGDLVLLQGPVGAGKSEFARYMLRAWSKQPCLAVPSPTFLLALDYERPADGASLLHVDLHRLYGTTPAFDAALVSSAGEWRGGSKERVADGDLDAIGWREAFGHSVVVCEWPQGLPPGAVSLATSAVLVSLSPAGTVSEADDLDVRRVILDVMRRDVGLSACELQSLVLQEEDASDPRGTDTTIQRVILPCSRANS
jgi:tRNA A37 threonylcarbamoyladenosine biosynthesis protein TsaE